MPGRKLKLAVIRGLRGLQTLCRLCADFMRGMPQCFCPRNLHRRIGCFLAGQYFMQRVEYPDFSAPRLKSTRRFASLNFFWPEFPKCKLGSGIFMNILDDWSFFPRASERRVLPIVGVCKTSSHLHIFSSSHLLIFTSSHPHIFSSSSHLHIFSSSHLLIFTSSHLHIFSSSHLLIFTSSHLHIFSSSHLLTLTSSPHLLIFSSSSHLLLIFSSSHLLIFTSSHLHIFSHLLIFTSSHIFSHLPTSSHIFSSSHLLISHLLLLPSCPLALSFFSRSLLKAGARNATLSHETRFDRQKLR